MGFGTEKYVRGTTAWVRHCSGDLAGESAFYYRGRGTKDRIYLNGEETTDGRGWARIASGPHTGEAWHLPASGGWPTRTQSPVRTRRA